MKYLFFLMIPLILLWAEKRIVGGFEVAEDKLQWIVGIVNYDFSSNQDISRYSICTGSIIGSRWVLTAKHCIDDNFPQAVYKPNEISVFYGSHMFDKNKQESTRTKRVHYSKNYDIALLELENRLNIPPVKVADQSNAYKYEVVG